METHTRKLAPETWRTYFDWMTRHMPAVRAEIEVAGLDIGDQIEGHALAIDGLSYDPSSHELVITATDDQLEHHIADPQEIYVLEELGQPSAVEILDAEGHKQILHITPLVELPPPPV
jgi:hypothetical protein